MIVHCCANLVPMSTQIGRRTSHGGLHNMLFLKDMGEHNCPLLMSQSGELNLLVWSSYHSWHTQVVTGMDC